MGYAKHREVSSSRTRVSVYVLQFDGLLVLEFAGRAICSAETELVPVQLQLYSREI